MNNKPLKLYIFCCSAGIDTDELLHLYGYLNGDTLKAISVPCSGKVDVLYLLKAFETGADGVVIVTCKNGECSYLEGNLRTYKRAEAVDSLLEEIGLGRGRIAVIQMKDGGPQQIIDEVQEFRVEIKKLVQSGNATHGIGEDAVENG